MSGVSASEYAAVSGVGEALLGLMADVDMDSPLFEHGRSRDASVT